MEYPMIQESCRYSAGKYGLNPCSNGIPYDFYQRIGVKGFFLS